MTRTRLFPASHRDCRPSREGRCGPPCGCCSPSCCAGGAWGSVRSSGDASLYLYHVVRALEGGPLPLRGQYSGMELGHPGPILYWVLIAGGWAARFLGFDPVSGAAVAYAASCSALLLAVVWWVRRGTGSTVSALASGSVLWWMLIQNPGGVWPIFSISFGSYLLVAAFAAGAAGVARNDRAGSAWAVVFAALAFQTCACFALPAVFISLLAVFQLWRARAGRLTAVAVLLGYGAIAARVFVDGLDFPLRYVQQTIAYQQVVSSTQVRLPLHEYVTTAWHLEPGNVQSAVVLGVLSVLGVLPALFWRPRWAVYLAASYVLSAAMLFTVVSKLHHSGVLTPFLPLGLGAGVGALAGGGSALLARLVRTDIWLIRLRRTLATATVLLVLAWAVSAGSGFNDGFEMPSRAFDGESVYNNSRIDNLESIVRSAGLAAGDTVGLLSTRPAHHDPLAETLPHAERFEIFAAFAALDITVCNGSGRNDTEEAEPASCSGKSVDSWVVFDDYGVMPPGYAIGTIEPIGDTDRLQVHQVQDPGSVGFIRCPHPPAPDSRWWWLESCDDVPPE